MKKIYRKVLVVIMATILSLTLMLPVTQAASCFTSGPFSSYEVVKSYLEKLIVGNNVNGISNNPYLDYFSSHKPLSPNPPQQIACNLPKSTPKPSAPIAFPASTPKATVKPQPTAHPTATTNVQPTQKPVVTPRPMPTVPKTPNTGTSYSSADEARMLGYINEDRAKKGLSALVMDAQLVKLARMKSLDMINKNYFSHQSPTYGSPFDMMRNNGVKFSSAGENIALNSDVLKAHVALMNSPGHYANIMSTSFTHVGIGVVKGQNGAIYITQMFIRK